MPKSLGGRQYANEKSRITAFFRPSPFSSSHSSKKDSAPDSTTRPTIEHESSDLTSMSRLLPESSSTKSRTKSLPQHRNDAPTDASPTPHPRSRDTSIPTSSMSSVPHSSSSFSRRIVLPNGRQAVANSDSDDVDDTTDTPRAAHIFIPLKRRKTSSSPRGTQHTGSSRGIGTSPYANGFVKQAATVPKTRLTYSLANMVKQKQEAEEANARIAAAEAMILEGRTLQETSERVDKVNEETLKAMFGGDSDEGERMMQAMQRTEALESPEQFMYFSSSDTCATAFAFPAECLPDEAWAGILQDEGSRTQACLTGFVAQLGARGRLPLEVTRWFAFQLVREGDQALCEAYAGIIESCISNDQPVHHSLASLNTFFPNGLEQDSHLRSDSQILSKPETRTQENKVSCLCGSTDNDGDTVLCESCNTWQHVSCYYPRHDSRKLLERPKHACVSCDPREVKVDTVRARRKKVVKPQGKAVAPLQHAVRPLAGLDRVVRVIEQTAPVVGIDAVTRAIADLALAAIDDRVLLDAPLKQTIKVAIDSLASTIPEDDSDEALAYLRGRLFNDDNISSTVQCRLVLSLPALTPASHDLRRQLALYCVTRDDQVRALSSPNWPKVIVVALDKSPRFSVNHRSADYGLLTNLVDVLDIAIGAGFSPSGFSWWLRAPPEATSGAVTAQPSNEEKMFNNQIDLIVAHLHTVMSFVKDLGATNLRRMEAKSALELVLLRLRHSVRTRPPPRKDLFGLDDASLEGQKMFLKKIFRPS